MATHYGSPPISHNNNNTEQRLVATVQYYYYYQKAGMTSYPSMTNTLKGKIKAFLDDQILPVKA